jgi:hypothetical protein
MNHKRLASLVVAPFLLAFSSPPAWANLDFSVGVNTTPLTGSAAGPFSFSVQLVDGSAAGGDSNNTATVSGFSFAGGSGSGATSLFGGATGSLAGTVQLADSAFFNALSQSFVAGSRLTFNVSLSTNVDVGNTPDEFSFAILDAQGSALPTTGLGNPLVVVDLDSGDPVIQTFTTTGGYAAIGAPIVDLVSPVPEPGGLWLLLAGLGAIGCLHRQRRAR